MTAPPTEELAEVLRPLTSAPQRTAIFCDVDGTLAPIVQRAENAHVPERTSRLLGTLSRRYGCVACISGRSAAEARRLVGVGGIAYAGAHGAELVEAGDKRPQLLPGFESWAGRVRAFAAERDGAQLRTLRIRLEEKSAIVAFHWRGAPDEAAARAHLEDVAREAEAAGFHPHWGRKVLEVRPPLPVDKGRAVRELVRRHGLRAALFAGDDVTDLDGFEALDALEREGTLDAAVRVGVRSEEGPEAVVARADVVVEGPPGFVEVLEALADS